VPTNAQRRETERRRLQRQLEERRLREASRKRFTMVASVVGTVVLIAAVVVIIVATSGSDKTNNGNLSQPGGGSNATSSSPAAPTSNAPALGTPAACATPGKAATATYKGVTVGKAADLTHEPKVSSTATTDPTALECQDLVVGKGAAASPTSTVSVQYTGVLYKDGKQFDSSWPSGKPTSFSLTGVVPGFTQGIGGTGKVAPMRVGGRRIMILPAALGYGAQAQGSIPANSTLVFVVDLKSVSG
jgi:peptidylprolyl isomerase